MSRGITTCGSSVEDRARRSGDHRNAFGALRLLFASMVIFSHVPEILDGDGHREIGQVVTGTCSLGGLAVYGFFVISGYLITTSSLHGRSRTDYLRKRCLRIYPGFIAASIVSLLFFAPLAGAVWPSGLGHSAMAAVARMAVLARPVGYEVFKGQHLTDPSGALNGALWTIQYEALCYLLVLPLILVPSRFRPAVTIGVSVACLIAGAIVAKFDVTWPSKQWLFPVTGIMPFNLVGIFFASATFAVVPAPVRATPKLALAAGAALLATLFSGYMIGLGFAIFGSYLILCLGELGGGSRLANINNRTDISYGVYLYAWPIERLLIASGVSSSLLVLDGLTLGLALVAGSASWHLVEKPALALGKGPWRQRRQRRIAFVAEPSPTA